MTLKRTNNQNNQPDKNDDFNFSIRWKMSPKLRKFISTATEAGQIIIKVGKILIPLLLVGSSVFQQPNPNHPQIPPQPDSIAVPNHKELDRSN